MKRTIEFLDADRNKVTAECEVSERNGYREFTMSGDYKGGGGQVFDEVSPDGDNQKKLIEMWKLWHLNGMFSGRKEPLPEDFEDELDELLDTIEAEEEEKSERPVEESDIDLFEDFNEPECALALALMLNLHINEIDDIVEEGNNRWCVHGTDYLVGTDDEMDEHWDDYLESYIDDFLEIPKNIEPYFDRESWKEDARVDGRKSALNNWNGEELLQKVNGTYYYAYRQ